MISHVTCFVEKARFEPRTLGTKVERYDHYATHPVKRTNYFLFLLITADCCSLLLNSLKWSHYCLLVFIITDYSSWQILLLLSIQVTACFFLELFHYFTTTHYFRFHCSLRALPARRQPLVSPVAADIIIRLLVLDQVCLVSATNKAQLVSD